MNPEKERIKRAQAWLEDEAKKLYPTNWLDSDESLEDHAMIPFKTILLGCKGDLKWSSKSGFDSYESVEQHAAMCNSSIPLADAAGIAAIQRPRIERRFIQTFGYDMFNYFIFITYRTMKKKGFPYELVLPEGYEFN